MSIKFAIANDSNLFINEYFGLKYSASSSSFCAGWAMDLLGI
jgi:hypothetical protein